LVNPVKPAPDGSFANGNRVFTLCRNAPVVHIIPGTHHHKVQQPNETDTLIDQTRSSRGPSIAGPFQPFRQVPVDCPYKEYAS
jgi:hypothetical protein